MCRVCSVCVCCVCVCVCACVCVCVCVCRSVCLINTIQPKHAKKQTALRSGCVSVVCVVCVTCERDRECV